ncbi:MAG: protein kinase [Cyanobacteria bacterium P01_F01_bin.150]
MICCLNAHCQKPLNSDGDKTCRSCGAPLVNALRNRYRPVRLIGQGGFGRTYLAQDKDRLNAKCVIKQFSPQVRTSNAMNKAVSLFNQEAMRLYELGEHPQIPALLAYFEQDGYLYLVQQYVAGQSLAQELVRQGPLTEGQIRAILADLLPVLQFVHGHQVIHRDITPMNILRRKTDGRMVLIDFGVAKQLSVEMPAQQGTRIGTEGYSPIEQFRGGRAYPASDLYSVGATCLHLLTNTRPDYLYDPLNGEWIWQAQLAEQKRSLTPGLTAILDKMLKDLVNERYQSANEVLDSLERLAPVKTSSIPKGTTNQPGSWSESESNTGNSQGANASDHQGTVVSPSGERIFYPMRLPSRAPISKPPDPSSSIHNSSPQSRTPLTPSRPPSGPLSRPPLPPSRPPSGPGLSGQRSGGPPRFKTSSSPNRSLRSSPRRSTPPPPPSRPPYAASAPPMAAASVPLRQDGISSTSKQCLCLYTLNAHASWITAVTTSPALSIFASSGLDDVVKVWNFRTGELMFTLKGHTGGINTASFSPNGKLLLSGSDDYSIKMWDAASGKLLRTLVGHSRDVTSVVVSADGKYVLSGGADRAIRIWDIGSGNLLKVPFGVASIVRSVAVSNDGQVFVSGGLDRKIKLWGMKSATLAREWTAHRAAVTAVAVSANNQMIVSAGKDRMIKLWDLQTGKLIRDFKGHKQEVNAIALTPNNQHLISGSRDASIRIWDTSNGKTIDVITDHSASVNAIAIHKQGKHFISGSSDLTIRVWQFR